MTPGRTTARPLPARGRSPGQGTRTPGGGARSAGALAVGALLDAGTAGAAIALAGLAVLAFLSACARPRIVP